MTSDIGMAPELTEGTAWRTGRIGLRSSGRRLLFGRVYEDSAIEMNAFARAGRVFCIASAGCTALELSASHEVVGCDINPAQIEYVKRRLAGGGPEIGAAERIMTFMRGFMPLAGWTSAKVRHFLAMEDPEAQSVYFRNELDNWRFRTGLDLLMSPLSLRRAYSPALLACLPPKFGAVLRERMRRGFARHPNRDNPYARALLLGISVDEQTVLPARARAAAIELVSDDAALYLERCAPGTFGGFSLSNILDGATAMYRERLFCAVRHAAAERATVVIRSFGEPPADLTTNRADTDRAMLWGVVDVRSVRELSSARVGDKSGIGAT